MNFGQNWLELTGRLERVEMGRNLIQGEMESITIPFYTPIQYILAIPIEMEWNP